MICSTNSNSLFSKENTYSILKQSIDKGKNREWSQLLDRKYFASSSHKQNQKQLREGLGYKERQQHYKRGEAVFHSSSVAFINWETNSLGTFNSSNNKHHKHHYLFACACGIYSNSSD